MKTPLIYGLLMALVGALLNFGLFFAGYHDTPEKLKSVQWVTGAIGFIAAIVLLLLAMRARRAEYPRDKAWSYGPAFGTGVLTGLWGCVFGALFNYLYFGVINPQFSDVIYQMQVQAMEAKGMAAGQISQAEGIMRKMISPAVMTITQALAGFVLTVILSLIIAIFVRKPAASLEPPPMAPSP